MKLLLLSLVFLIGCGKGEALTEVARNTGNFTEDIGKGIESIGQIPGKLGKKALGVDDLEDEVDNNTNNIDQLAEELEDLRQEIYSITGDLLDKLSVVELDLYDLEVNTSLQIARLHKILRLKLSKLRREVSYLFRQLSIGDSDQYRIIYDSITELQVQVSSLENELSDLVEKIESGVLDGIDGIDGTDGVDGVDGSNSEDEEEEDEEDVLECKPGYIIKKGKCKKDKDKK